MDFEAEFGGMEIHGHSRPGRVGEEKGMRNFKKKKAKRRYDVLSLREVANRYAEECRSIEEHTRSQGG